MTATTVFHQDFKVLSNDIEGFAFQNGAIRVDTGSNKATTLSQGSEPRLSVSDQGAINISARENQNISLSATGSGKVNISGLDLTVYGVKKQTVTVNHEEGQKDLTVIKPTSGSMTVHISGQTEGGSDAAACFLCAKRIGSTGICNLITSVPGTSGESLSLKWENDTLTLKVNGSLGSYATTTSDYNVRILCSH